MMMRSILVPTDGSHHSETAARYAIQLARAFAARISLLGVVDIRLLEGPIISELLASGEASFGRQLEAVRTHLEQRTSQSLERLACDCAASLVACDRRIVTGIVSREIIDSSRSCDFVVMGQYGQHADWRGPLLGSVVESVVRGTIRPVMVTPEEYRPFSRVLVAYDGSRNASGALAAAAELAQGTELGIVVITVDRDAERGQARLTEARRFLGTKQLVAAVVDPGGRPDDAILAACRTFECDLIAMGAYGHSPVRELILGSTTARVMRNATCPLILFR